MWDTHTRKLHTTFPHQHGAPASALAFSPANKLLLSSCGLDKKILFYGILPSTLYLSSIIYHLSSIIYHLSSIIYHLSSIIYHLSSIIYHLSSIIYHLSSIIYHLSMNLWFVRRRGRSEGVEDHQHWRPPQLSQLHGGWHYTRSWFYPRKDI